MTDSPTYWVIDLCWEGGGKGEERWSTSTFPFFHNATLADNVYHSFSLFKSLHFRLCTLERKTKNKTSKYVVFLFFNTKRTSSWICKSREPVSLQVLAGLIFRNHFLYKLKVFLCFSRGRVENGGGLETGEEKKKTNDKRQFVLQHMKNCTRWRPHHWKKTSFFC